MILSLLSLERVAVIAHRGGAKLRPENTIAAFDHAVSLGVDGLECDVHLSRDGEVVVIHDATLDRTTDAIGPIAARTADQLARVDAGFGFGPKEGHPYRGQGVGVPRLAEMLDRYRDLPVIVEMKGDRPGLAARVIEAVRAARAEDRVILAGFSQAVLKEARRLAPEIPTSASRDEVRSAMTRSQFWRAPKLTGYRVFQVPLRVKGREVLRSRLVRAARRAGIPVQAWVIDDPHDMRRLIDWGVTGIISDRPDVAIGVARLSDPRPSHAGTRRRGVATP